MNGTVDQERVRRQLARILADPLFAAAPQLSRLLKWLVEAALDGNARDVKEVTLGIEVFDLGVSFDPKSNNLVRSHARRLRQRLKEYYGGPGRADPIVIEIPTGHYVARFHEQSAHGSVVSPNQVTVVDANARLRRARWQILGGSLALAGVVFAGAYALRYWWHQDAFDRIENLVELRRFEVTTDTVAEGRLASQISDSLDHDLSTSGIKTITDVRPTEGGLRAPRAEFTLRGAVEQVGDELIASAKILHQPDSRVLWSTTLRRGTRAIGSFDRQFSIRVASVLKCALRLRRHAENDPSSDLFSMLLVFCEIGVENRHAEGPEAARRIRDAYPQYAVGHALCAGANALMTLVDYRHNTPAEQARMRALVYECAKTALDKDRHFGTPYYAQAIVLDPNVGYAEREGLLRRALEVDPDFLFARNFYGMLLAAVGRSREARAYFARHGNDEPLVAGGRLQRARAAVMVGDMPAARALYAEASALMVGALAVEREWGWAEHWLGEPELAADLLKSDQASGVIPKNSWNCLETFLDARSRGVRLSEAAIEVACDSGFHAAAEQIYAYFGHVDAAFRRLEANIADYSDAGPFAGPNLLSTLFSSQMRSVRADPRFMQFVARLGLVEYWTTTKQWPDFCAIEVLQYDCETWSAPQ
jgi:tetratricopeptide (TPR) repeat protein